MMVQNNENNKKKYVAFNGKEFINEDNCRTYENACRIVAQKNVMDCSKVISEYDLYNSMAGSEEYCYLIVKLTKENKDDIIKLGKIYKDDLPILEIGKTYVFGLGYLYTFNANEESITIEHFEQFYSYGTKEDFIATITENFNMLDLD